MRAFNSVGGQPIVFDRVKGPYAWDVDGNKYIDYIGSWGPAIVGAADDEVNAALHTQLDKGTSFGAPCALEVRFCNQHLQSLDGCKSALAFAMGHHRQAAERRHGGARALHQ